MEDNRNIVVTGINIPFWNLMITMVKFILASIPAIAIASLLIFAIGSIIMGGLAGWAQYLGER